jgi:hypothetical protein
MDQRESPLHFLPPVETACPWSNALNSLSWWTVLPVRERLSLYLSAWRTLNMQILKFAEVIYSVYTKRQSFHIQTLTCSLQIEKYSLAECFPLLKNVSLSKECLICFEPCTTSHMPKGTVSRDFCFRFFMNHLPPSPLK